MIVRVISGGQTGVDQAALEAAYRLGISTGGLAPSGWRTDDGPNKELLYERYGLACTSSPKYPQRTRLNVLHSDATLILARDPTSPGVLLTALAARTIGRQSLLVRLRTSGGYDRTPEQAVEWLLSCVPAVRVLNVAGNRERTQPGIYDQALAFLTDVLQSLPYEA